VRQLDDQFTAQAFITTDVDDNQITAFHPGAMSFSHLNRSRRRAEARLAIVSPDGRQGMVEHTRDLAARGCALRLRSRPGAADVRRRGAARDDEGRARLTVNDYEARIVEQKTGRKVRGPRRRTAAVIVTRRRRRIERIRDGQRIDVPAVAPESVVDPTGCGDAYRSGLLYGMARGWAWRKCAQLASVMGSIKIAHRGGRTIGPRASRSRPPFSRFRRNTLKKEKRMRRNILGNRGLRAAAGRVRLPAGSQRLRAYQVRGEQTVHFGVVESVRECASRRRDRRGRRERRGDRHGRGQQCGRWLGQLWAPSPARCWAASSARTSSARPTNRWASR
jgi:hypothetical protein